MVIPRVFVKEVSEYFDYSIGVIRLQYSSISGLVLRRFGHFGSLLCILLEISDIQAAKIMAMVCCEVG